MPADGQFHDVIAQSYAAGGRPAQLRDISSRPAAVLIAHAANKSQRRQELTPANPELLSRKCAIRGFGVRETLRYAAQGGRVGA
jgi:hypothetical protein